MTERPACGGPILRCGRRVGGSRVAVGCVLLFALGSCVARTAGVADPEPGPFGARVSGLVGDGISDEWNLAGEAGDFIGVEARSDRFSAVVEVVSPGGDVLARGEDGGTGSGARATALLPAAGEYRVRVAAGESSAEGEYLVVARRMEVRDLELDALVSATADEPMVWRFAGAAEQAVCVRASSGDFDAVVRLMASDGGEIGSADGGGRGADSCLDVTLPAAGAHFVLVATPTGLFPAGGSYSVGVFTEPPPAGPRIEMDVPVTAELGSDGRDVWSFDGVAGQVVIVEVGSSDFDTVIRLVAPAGEEIASDDDGGDRTDSALTATLPASGVYEVEVTSFDARAGVYEIVVRAVAPDPEDEV